MFSGIKKKISCPVGCDTHDYRRDGVPGTLICLECHWIHPFDEEGKFLKPTKVVPTKKPARCGCESCGR